MAEKFTTYYNSPIGLLEIIGSENGVSSILFAEAGEASTATPSCLQSCVLQLDEYFSGVRTEFSLALNLQGTEFQKKVWSELCSIPFGKTVTYLDIAIALGNRKSIRAVGSANGSNPLCIVVPCHRVIGTNGSLVGYGGGLWRKAWLLNFENRAGQADLFDEQNNAKTKSGHAAG